MELKTTIRVFYKGYSVLYKVAVRLDYYLDGKGWYATDVACTYLQGEWGYFVE